MYIYFWLIRLFNVPNLSDLEIFKKMQVTQILFLPVKSPGCMETNLGVETHV